VGDQGLCNVCRGSGSRRKVDDVGHYRTVICYACHGTGRWHRAEDRWPYARTGPSR